MTTTKPTLFTFATRNFKGEIVLMYKMCDQLVVSLDEAVDALKAYEGMVLSARALLDFYGGR
jgi:hypothetical protein